jgi:hypothetical protein
MPKFNVTKTGNSNIQIVDVSAHPFLLAALPAATIGSAKAMKREYAKKMLEMFDEQPWPPNMELTQFLKGHDEVYAGLSDTMLEIVQDAARGGTRMEVVGGTTFRTSATIRGGMGGIAIGWPDEPHPDRESQKGNSIASIALWLETGFVNKQTGSTVAARPWLTRVADENHVDVLNAGVKEFTHWLAGWAIPIGVINGIGKRATFRTGVRGPRL